MIYQVDRIIHDVRVAMDENHVADGLLGISPADIDTLHLEEVIESKIEEGVRLVESKCPYYLLDGGVSIDSGPYWTGGGKGYMLLPRDFMRLMVFRMSDWVQAVHIAISQDDPLYELQQSRYQGISGNWQRPVCAIAVRPEGKVLEFYSCESEEAEVVQAEYLPYPVIDRDGGVEISERCYRNCVYMIVALVLNTIGESDKATAMAELAGNYN